MPDRQSDATIADAHEKLTIHFSAIAFYIKLHKFYGQRRCCTFSLLYFSHNDNQDRYNCNWLINLIRSSSKIVYSLDFKIIFIYIGLAKALPMVTIIVGKCNNAESKARIVTCCNGADEPTSISFDLNNLTVGKPK